MLVQNGFDLTEFNAKTAQLDLIVETPQEFEVSVRTPATQVARAVEPRIGIVVERIGDESLGRQLRTVQIAPGQTRTADVQFTRNTDRNRIATERPARKPAYSQSGDRSVWIQVPAPAVTVSDNRS